MKNPRVTVALTLACLMVASLNPPARADGTAPITAPTEVSALTTPTTQVMENGSSGTVRLPV